MLTGPLLGDGLFFFFFSPVFLFRDLGFEGEE